MSEASEQRGGDLLVPIGGTMPLECAVVGGKAWSLQRLAVAGCQVPPAVVLTTAFFAPWIERIRAGAVWQALVQAPPDEWPAHCGRLQAELKQLEWEPAQRRALDQLRLHCLEKQHAAGLAVRSSSPDEDLALASFAGVYRTCLGVPAGGVEQAIRACFASCLDLPVFAYKTARGLPVFEPALAVIVQQQVDSDVSGVGFSINPLTNDHDELLVSASWGLGDAVVDGRVMADQFVIDKASGRLLGSTPGSKRFSSVLAPEGGTRQCREPRSGQSCLVPAQIDDLAGRLRQIEVLFGGPVDVEFAYASGVLHILQARLVTTHVPLAPRMMSKPGAPRTLYMDVALAKGLTLNAPVSPMGQDWLKHTIDQMVRRVAGDFDFALDRPDGWLCIEGGRVYLNLSRLLWLTTPRQIARSNAPTDVRLGGLLTAIDVARYRSPSRPSLFPLLRLLPRMLWRLRRLLWRSVVMFAAPEYAHRRYSQRLRQAQARLSVPVDREVSLRELQESLGTLALDAVIDIAMPAMVAGTGAMGGLAQLARRHCAVEQELVAKLMRGAGGNPVVDMGVTMFRLARMLRPLDFADIDALAARIDAGDLPPAFLAGWTRFLDCYGCRGPGEMDLANPGYRDEPRMLLRQMSFMAAARAEDDPGVAHRALAGQREAAYRQLLGRFGPVRRLLLRRLYSMSGLFAGARDTPKHLNLLFRQQLRKQALACGAELARRGQLDRAHDVFGLSYADLEAAGSGSPVDLRARRRERLGFIELLARQVRTFPALIDSRGRIPRATPPGGARAGQLHGTAISPGIARGRVKCLRSAHAQSIAPGDVLVAFTTDPGWTPLFVNAAAIVLEVGGVLQHGALVAREFNKPCVAGISDVFALLLDGQMVEVDGGRGTISILEEPGSNP